MASGLTDRLRFALLAIQGQRCAFVRTVLCGLASGQRFVLLMKTQLRYAPLR